MALWTAFLLGFVGSLHCAGMCGPLALALPVVGKTRATFFLSRLTYNFGRIVTYGLLGVLFGQLTKRVPNVDGGLYAYSRHEFGDFAGYLTAWCYWITCWAGNAAISQELFNRDGAT